jgi:hypothetical protein
VVVVVVVVCGGGVSNGGGGKWSWVQGGYVIAALYWHQRRIDRSCLAPSTFHHTDITSYCTGARAS